MTTRKPKHAPPKEKIHPMRFAIVNETTELKLTTELLVRIAAALASQQVDFGKWWQGDPIPITLFGAQSVAPKDCCLVVLQDTLPVADALGYHDVDASGRPRIFVGWHVIRDNGGTLNTGSNSLSAVMSHELLEATADPYASFWADMGYGANEVALEVADPVEGDSYEVDSIALSNFVGPKWFSLQLGEKDAYDRMGKLTAPFSMSPGGYIIVRSGGPGGIVDNVFARGLDDGGMPLFKRQHRGDKRLK